MAVSHRVALSDGAELDVDRIVFATGYRADVGAVAYLPAVAATDGFPDLDESFGTSIPGLYVPGFLATRDFGPFFGFVRGAVPAATIIARDLARRLARVRARTFGHRRCYSHHDERGLRGAAERGEALELVVEVRRGRSGRASRP